MRTEQKIKTRTLIIDNTIDRPWSLGSDFRRYLTGEVLVRRGPEGDIPRDLTQITHIIISGSKTSCLDSSSWVMVLMEFIQKAFELRIPVLGVCFGHQLIARAFGGERVVQRSSMPEFGWVEIRQTTQSVLLAGLPESFFSFQYHFEEVSKLPEDFIPIASNSRCLIQGFCHKEHPVFGIQFHPEKNFEEGQQAIEAKKKFLPKDCIFNTGRAKFVFNEDVANTVFRNFLNTRIGNG